MLINFTSKNQMQDAMTIWDSICHSQWFKQTSIVGILYTYYLARTDELAIDLIPQQG